MIKIIKVSNKKQLDEFIDFPNELYKNDEFYIKPLRRDYKKYLLGETTAVNKVGESQMFLAYKDGKAVGRIMAGTNEELNEYKNIKDAYFSQYEAIDDPDVSKALYNAVFDWCREKGMTKLKGPMSLPGGDDNRGFLCDNFDDYPTIQNVYNKPYYTKQAEENGLVKYHDCYAFGIEPSEELLRRYGKVIPYAMEKYKFRLDKINLGKEAIKPDAKDISEVIKKGMPETEDWIDFMPPSDEEINDIVNACRPLADNDFIFIARNEKNEPIAFNITMPDYNQVIKKMNGKMNFRGIITFLNNKKKIDRLRVFVLFVIPEYRNKGVTQAMYYQMMKSAVEKGYKSVEGSTIWDYNVPMLNDLLKAGGKITKTYRVYQYDL